MLIVLVILSIFGGISTIRIPDNPCPEIFSYKYDNGLNYGEIQIPYDGQKQLNFNMNISLIGIYENIGIKLELITKLDDIRSNTLLKYRIDFPLQNILPKITQIVYNGRLYCSGPPETLSPRGVTNLWANLQHFIYTVPVRFDVNRPTIMTTTTIKPSIEHFNTIPNEDLTTIRTKTTTEFPQRVANHNQNDCGIANDIQTLIVNGAPTADNEFPWLVGLFKRKGISYDFQCTANLITNRHIITAAHCVRFYNAPLINKDDILLVMGNSNLTNWASSKHTILRTAKTIIVHPNYRQYTAHCDLVIIEMNEPVMVRNEIRPVCLWSNNINNNVDGNGIVAGWGKDENGKETIPQPHKVHMPIVTQEECLRSNSAYNNLTSELTFCAGQRNNQGPCTGDSGAGFIIKYQNKWYLKGLVSIALKQDNSFNCNLNQYVVFVDIFKLIDWINNVINM